MKAVLSGETVRKWTVILAIFALATSLGNAADYDARKVVGGLAAKCRDAQSYSLEGTLEVAGQRGPAPGMILAKAKFSVAKGPEGRFRLELSPVDKDSYLLVSSGQKSWAYVPKLKSYTQVEGATAEGDAEEEGDDADSERDLSEVFVRTLVATLGRMTDNISSIEIGTTTKVKVEGKKDEWPWLRVLSKPSQSGTSRLLEFAFDPQTLTVGKLTAAEVSYEGKEKTVVRINAEFSRFRLNEPVPVSDFTFDPPKNAKLVDTLPIPGQTGSYLLNKPAPDFELKTLEGEKVRLSELRGKPVLLSFWASWCGPCRRELPSLEKIHAELQYKGLVVLGVNDEGKGTAKKYATTAGLTFETVDDSSRKAHGLYRVRSIPSVFLFDAEGKVVRFFRGAQEEKTLRAAIAGMGAGIAK